MKRHNKLCIVINGKGAAGKDTLCHAAAKCFKTRNISAITPIKEIAINYGWKGEKDLASRRFLAELKRVFADYNDLPNQYLLSEYKKFISSESEILFVHIREKDQIEKFVSQANSQCVTLLITRTDPTQKEQYGNAADDCVNEYSYDYTFDNSLPLCESVPNFLDLMQKIIKDNNLNIEMSCKE